MYNTHARIDRSVRLIHFVPTGLGRMLLPSSFLSRLRELIILAEPPTVTLDDIDNNLEKLLKRINDSRLVGTDKLFAEAVQYLHTGMKTIREMMKTKEEKTDAILAIHEKQFEKAEKAMEVINKTLGEHREVLTEFTQNFIMLNGIALGVSLLDIYFCSPPILISHSIDLSQTLSYCESYSTTLVPSLPSHLFRCYRCSFPKRALSTIMTRPARPLSGIASRSTLTTTTWSFTSATALTCIGPGDC